LFVIVDLLLMFFFCPDGVLGDATTTRGRAESSARPCVVLLGGFGHIALGRLGRGIHCFGWL